MLNRDQLQDRRFRKDDIKTEYCQNCKKKTEHRVSEGHTGLDSWSSAECLVCGDIS